MRRVALALWGAQMTLGSSVLLLSDRIAGTLTYVVLAALVIGVAVGAYAALAAVRGDDGPS